MDAFIKHYFRVFNKAHTMGKEEQSIPKGSSKKKLVFGFKETSLKKKIFKAIKLSSRGKAPRPDVYTAIFFHGN